ncbi:MAG: lytic transglycosylase domain-containing protein, partial [Caulobacteraceae bacterium]|nr:lytic transglycosylase domain-containing protein [Caulobacteraceae bacterium]
TDPVDFIECIPFSETRDYVMRVLEATQVYRARLAGGSAPITLPADLKRGAYGYAGGYAARGPVRATGAYESYPRPSAGSPAGAAMAPIPDPVGRAR